jgi:hypothetical protein
MFKFRGLAATVAVSLLLAGVAQANEITIPDNAVFTNPNINYVSHGAGATVRDGRFSMNVGSLQGDAFAIDLGDGYAATTGSLVLDTGLLMETSTVDQLNFASGGTFSLIAGGDTVLVGDVGELSLVRNEIGWEFLGGISATGGTLQDGFKNDGVVFGLLYNVTGAGTEFTANVKGDIAAIRGNDQGGGQNPPPVIPEPATIALVTMGLGSFFASARRRMS